MTKTFGASVKAWSDKAKRNAKLVVAEASENVYMAMTEIQAGVKETGGSFQPGRVPVDTGFLVGSVQISLNDSLVGQGSYGSAPDFVGVVAGLEFGDSIEAAFTAEYAAAMNYGTVHMPGRFFVTNAVAQWPAFVAAAAAKY